MYSDAASLFSMITFMKTYDDLKLYASTIGYDLNADYRMYSDPNDHDNYQKFFALHVLLGEIESLNPEKGDMITVCFDPAGDDLIAKIAGDSDDDMIEMQHDFHNIKF
jgi:hypothetical protein